VRHAFSTSSLDKGAPAAERQLLAGRTIIVTGASSGIGRAMALAFAAHGAFVVNGDVRADPREGGTPTEELIRAAGGESRYVETDISRAGDVDRLVEVAVGERGRLDVLVNNAMLYGTHNGPVLATGEGDWDAMMDVGLRGVFLCCRRALRQMLGQEPRGELRGRIVNMASQVAFLGSPGSFTSNAIKGAVVGMTRQLAVEFAPRGVAVNAIAPGRIPTDESDPPEVAEHARLRAPIPRVGLPEDVARLAVFMASDACTFMAGATVPVDGGWLAAS
jgi:NAD(P)-dependent dehydrogenase (short-subunit alcohol dehydrogenase family)